MKTNHQIVYCSSTEMAGVADQCVDLIVTSPPYPMIEMWDEGFGKSDPRIAEALNRCQGALAFDLMHAQLDRVWREVYRVLKAGGLACINIGDATRTLGDEFQLYANHSRMVSAFLSLGFSQLPAILWRKPTNSPNKFMGSGMLPPNAYVTLEHEYILIFRKKGKRVFPTEEEKELRRASAYFWEERNAWFSDVWFDLVGTSQGLNNTQLRARSGAYPFELPHRLIHMFSVKGDTVLDPFLGTGTTLVAAMCAGRNSIGFEIEPAFQTAIEERIGTVVGLSQLTTRQRFAAHLRFVTERTNQGKSMGHQNLYYHCPVITNQEKKLQLDSVQEVVLSGKNQFTALLAPWQHRDTPDELRQVTPLEPKSGKTGGAQQRDLF